MDRSKLTMIVSAASAVVIGGGLLAFALMQSGKSTEAKDNRDKADRKLKKVYSSEIFPDDANIGKLKMEKEQIASLFDAMQSTLLEKNLKEVDEVSPSLFTQLLQQLASSLYTKAPIVESKKSMQEDFRLGFDRYLGEQAKMPPQEAVSRLVSQMTAISEIVNAFFESGVNEVRKIVRQEFEVDESGEPTLDNLDVYAIDNNLYRAEHYEFEVLARQGALGTLFNKLAHLKYFAVVTDMSVTKSGNCIVLPNSGGEDGRGKGRHNKRPRHDEDDEERTSKREEISSLPPEKRLMTGPDLDKPLIVKFGLDVYNFKSAESEAK